MRYAMMMSFLILIGSVQGLAAEVQRPIVYPKNGQTMEKQSLDAGACRSWAMQQTGMDPAYLEGQLSVAGSQTAPKEMPIARGAIRGVAAGAALGGINKSMDDGAGKGATMGVTAGAMRGLAQRRDNARAAQVQQSQQQVQQIQNQYSTYNRAFSACMTGKGYSVS